MDAIEAIELELGTSPSGEFASVRERFESLSGWNNSFSYIDKIPDSPNAMDDEFDDGSFNSTLWSDLNFGTMSRSESGSALTFYMNENVNHLRGIYQPTPSGAWTFMAKLLPISDVTATLQSNLFVGASTTGQIYDVSIWIDGAPSVRSLQFASPTSTVASWGSDYSGIGSIPIYAKAQYDGNTTVVFSWSPSGEPNSFVTMGTATSFTPGIVGLGFVNRLGQMRSASFDWFRRTA